MEKIGVGIVGLGGIANAIHIPQILDDDRYEIKAICDLQLDKLLEVGNKLKVPENKRYTDYKQLIKDVEVQVVDIATSNDVHYAIAKYTIDNNKDYIVEKPITLNYDQAKSLEEETIQRKLNSLICFSYRYKSAARYCKHLIQNERRIGDITHVNAQYYQAWALPEVNVPLEWRFEKSKAGSGALGDLGSHMLDLVMFMTGLQYKSVSGQLGTYVKKRKKVDSEEYGTVDVDDYSNFLIKTKQEASISFEISRLAFGRGNYQRVEIYGTNGCLVYLLDDKPDQDELYIISETSEGILKKQLEIPVEFNKTQMHSFADVIKGNADGLDATICDGAINQYYLDKIIEASETGKEVLL